MAYNPNLYSPYGQHAVNGLIRVSGLESAMAYPMPANSVMPFFDKHEDLMYVKRTDGVGFPTAETYRLERIQVDQERSEKTVSRKEFDRLIERLEKIEKQSESEEKTYAEQPIRRAEGDE